MVVDIADFRVITANAIPHGATDLGTGCGCMPIGRRVGEILSQMVGGVRIEVMHPKKEGLHPLILKPGNGSRRDIFRKAAGAQELIAPLHVLVVVLEPMGKAGQVRNQWPGADEGCVEVAEAAQDLGQVKPLGVLGDGDAVDANPVLLRISAGEERNVGRTGQRDRAVGVLEANPLGGQTVNVGTGLAVVAVTGKMIGPQGIDGNQQNVRRVGRVGTVLACGRHCCNQQCGQAAKGC